MATKTPQPDIFRRRLVGLYALTLMERDGPLHGYGLSEAIARRTEGAWRPGPGAVYPSLRKLSGLGLAKARVRDRRREYVITPRGRLLLRRVRMREGVGRARRPDLTALWSEVQGADDVDEFLLHRLRRTLASIENRIASEAQPAGTALRARVTVELDHARGRLAAPGRAPPGEEPRNG